MVIWIVGLAGAGKSTVGRHLAERLRAEGRPVALLDGDMVRQALGDDLGHGRADRMANGRRIGGLCALLERQGIDVVACVLAIDPDQLAWNRRVFGSYLEVFLDVPWATLEARDQKGLYSGAREGRTRDVVGVDIPWVPPAAPDIVLAGSDTPAECARDVDGIAELVLARCGS